MRSSHAGSARRRQLHRRELLTHLGVGAAIEEWQAGRPPPREPGRIPRRLPSDDQTGQTRSAFRRTRSGSSAKVRAGSRFSLECLLNRAAALGFDGVEILHVQMEDESNATLQKIKRQAHSLGLALMGFSTHQGFVTPNQQERHTNVQKTLYQIDLAYRLGIPTMRINTGRWGTIKSFDDFMAKKGPRADLGGSQRRRSIQMGDRFAREALTAS